MAEKSTSQTSETAEEPTTQADSDTTGVGQHQGDQADQEGDRDDRIEVQQSPMGLSGQTRTTSLGCGLGPGSAVRSIGRFRLAGWSFIGIHLALHGPRSQWGHTLGRILCLLSASHRRSNHAILGLSQRVRSKTSPRPSPDTPTLAFPAAIRSRGQVGPRFGRFRVVARHRPLGAAAPASSRTQAVRRAREVGLLPK